jgi:hypothetical protein
VDTASLRSERDSGLADPDDAAGPVPAPSDGSCATLGVALDRLLDEVEALRRARVSIR